MDRMLLLTSGELRNTWSKQALQKISKRLKMPRMASATRSSPNANRLVRAAFCFLAMHMINVAGAAMATNSNGFGTAEVRGSALECVLRIARRYRNWIDRRLSGSTKPYRRHAAVLLGLVHP